jgi:hypothetical protein
MSGSNFLIQSERALLSRWMHDIRFLFPREQRAVPYLVGSVMTTPDYRDVDVRTILSDENHAALAAVIDLDRLALAVSLWGQRATGLPIDWQVQQQTAANEEFRGIRDACGIRYALDLQGPAASSPGGQV